MMISRVGISNGVGERNFLLGVPIDCRSLETLVSEVRNALDGKNRVIFACANPHSLVVAQRDPNFLDALNRAHHVVADGVGVILAARCFTGGRFHRITGFDYFQAVMKLLSQRGGGRVFFFGSSNEVLGRIEERFAKEYSSLTLCGTFSPPFGGWSPAENMKMLETIRNAKPDVLWVGMTAPKQEKWVDSIRELLYVPVIGSIGAVFDFYAGTQKRAPEWMRKSGLEWCYRLLREPRRMWRRELLSPPEFLYWLLRQHLFRK